MLRRPVVTNTPRRSQRVSSVENADMIIILDNGQISAVGTHNELLKTSAIYQEVFYSQQKGGEE